MLNGFSILLESRYLITKLYKYDANENVLSFTFYHKGKPKIMKIKNDKKFNFFDYLYQSYTRMFSIKYNEQKILILKDIGDTLYDLTGLPIVSFDFKNKIQTSRLLLELKNMVYNSNMILLLINEEDIESTQFAHQILTNYELLQLIKYQEYKFKEEKSPNKESLDNYTLGFTQLNNIIFKLRALSDKCKLNTLFSERVLMDDDQVNTNFVKELYPDNMLKNYSWISLNEITTKFSKLILLENMRFEQQINGKFIKCLRADSITEYKTKWIYSFNVTNDNFEMIIGLHQPSMNYTTINSYLYAGLVILKSNRPFLTFVDYLPLKDTRQNFLKLKLTKGSYVVVPITSGFYFDNGEANIPFNEVSLFEKKMDVKKNKMLDDFSPEAKYVIDVCVIV
jgi:hypothetical protein